MQFQYTATSGPYRSVRVQVASHVFNFKLKLLLRSVLGTLCTTLSSQTFEKSQMLIYLECQMLQEMSCAIGFVCFCP